MLATSGGELPEDDRWTYEVKWDGYRTLALKDGGRVQLLSRSLSDATAHYPSITLAIAHGIRQRFGAVGQYGSIAIIERMWKTPKEFLGVKRWNPVHPRDMQRCLDVALTLPA
jgi:hypothetical protein